MSDLSESLRAQRTVALIRIQERAIGVIARSLDVPQASNNGHPGLRFSNPGWKHFCLLKSMRAVSGLNACCLLYDGGYCQEIPVILRTIGECTAQIDFVIAGVTSEGDLAPKQNRFVTAYFEDSVRDSSGSSKKLPLKQIEFHEGAGLHTEELLRRIPGFPSLRAGETAKALSTIYRINSNFVHSRYPEVMEMIDGKPLAIHLRGMRGTPKDEENLDVLEGFVSSVTNSIRFMLFYMGLMDQVESDPTLREWYELRAA
jgi:hypothetical protein